MFFGILRMRFFNYLQRNFITESINTKYKNKVNIIQRWISSFLMLNSIFTWDKIHAILHCRGKATEITENSVVKFKTSSWMTNHDPLSRTLLHRLIFEFRCVWQNQMVVCLHQIHHIKFIAHSRSTSMN